MCRSGDRRPAEIRLSRCVALVQPQPALEGRGTGRFGRALGGALPLAYAPFGARHHAGRAVVRSRRSVVELTRFGGHLILA